ncbi:bifunctional NAD(P)H-hydrate repair enzyme [Bombiscardovia apis]|uniref:Multifunctional fusion protein n=2 Tax=Bombiscardovia apis TaxID=2932182 RepID=A0ABN6SFD6_9BIFI|nr:bifunctional NAD(P)H-hydrate repair enzyme [Bombiscardovia apis]
MVKDEYQAEHKLARTAYRSQVIRSLEQPLLEDGQPLMQKAGQAVAANAWLMLSMAGIDIEDATVAILAGGGNNGGDGLYAGAQLAAWGAEVTALATGTQLHDRATDSFVQAGGTIWVLSPQANIPFAPSADDTSQANERLQESIKLVRHCDIIIDAMTGIGANGPLHGIAQTLAATVGQAEGSIQTASYQTQPWKADRPLILAVDVPSGVNVDMGTLPGAYIPADVTVSFGALKPCSLLPPAAYVCGRTVLVDLGFDVEDVQADVEAMTAEACASLLKVPTINDSKYTRGVVGLVTGSARYPGAAVLSSKAAVACNVGMIRYIGPEQSARSVVEALPEATVGAGRVQSLVVGSGVPTSKAAQGSESQRDIIRSILEGSGDEDGTSHSLPREDKPSTPVLIDAGALDLLPHAQLTPNFVITPHFGELAELLSRYGEEVSAARIAQEPLAWAIEAWKLTGATVLLKGAITLVICDGDDEGNKPQIYTSGFGPTWLSTAGSGDVLSGVEGAFLASQADLIDGDMRHTGQIAAAGAYLHGLAASLASNSRERAWKKPLIVRDDQLSEFVEDAQKAWSIDFDSADGFTAIGHPIHASDIVNELEHAQEVLLALRYAPDSQQLESNKASDDDTGHAQIQNRSQSLGYAGTNESERMNNTGIAAASAFDSLWF